MPGFKQGNSGGYNNQRRGGNQQRGGYNNRNQGGADDEYKAERVAGLFRREGQYGVFWTSPTGDAGEGYEFVLSPNENFVEGGKQNEFILFRKKSKPYDPKK